MGHLELRMIQDSDCIALQVPESYWFCSSFRRKVSPAARFVARPAARPKAKNVFLIGPMWRGGGRKLSCAGKTIVKKLYARGRGGSVIRAWNAGGDSPMPSIGPLLFLYCFSIGPLLLTAFWSSRKLHDCHRVRGRRDDLTANAHAILDREHALLFT